MRKLAYLLAFVFVALGTQVMAQATAKTTVEAASAKIYKGPSAKTPIVATAKKGEAVTVYAEYAAPLIKVSYKGKTGYAKLSELKSNAQIAEFAKATKLPTPDKKPQLPQVQAGKVQQPAMAGDVQVGTFNGKPVFQGPKGGKYTLGAGAKKTYLTPAQVKQVQQIKGLADPEIGRFNDKIVYQGPKGGKYYLNPQGKKVYLTPAQVAKITR